MDQPTPYTVDVPQAVLDDLRDRLARTRWIDDFVDGDPEWAYGVSQRYLRELCDHWRTEFDWRAQEAAINAFPQLMFDVDGQPIHVVHARSPHPDATPLLLVHGWPGSVFEYVNVLGRLTDPVAYGGDAGDAFHVVLPSIPGYGFSGPTRSPGWGPTRIAAGFAEVMRRLGYDRYGAAGGDWGAIITTQLARDDAGRHLSGLHLTMPLAEPPPPGRVEPLTPTEQQGLDDWAAHQANGTVIHVQVNSTRPHTLAFGLNDSPAGLAAWLVDKYRSYSDCGGDVETAFTRDEILTEITTYWVTGTIASASRLYVERARERSASPGRIEVPTGCAIFPRDVRRMPRPWAERMYRIERWTEMPAGGHFPGLEQPDALVRELREFFRGRRA